MLINKSKIFHSDSNKCRLSLKPGSVFIIGLVKILHVLGPAKLT